MSTTKCLGLFGGMEVHPEDLESGESGESGRIWRESGDNLTTQCIFLQQLKDSKFPERSRNDGIRGSSWNDGNPWKSVEAREARKRTGVRGSGGSERSQEAHEALTRRRAEGSADYYYYY